MFNNLYSTHEYDNRHEEYEALGKPSAHARHLDEVLYYRAPLAGIFSVPVSGLCNL